MTSVNPPNPPNFNGINYNSSFWATSQTGLTYNQIAKQFLKFPVAQGTETVFDFNVQGELTISGTGNGITFPDDTKQTTAFIEANYAQLNTDNTFLSPYQNTFQGSNSSGPTTGPIKISNVSSGEYGTLYVDPNPNSDLTLYSNQGSSGGLTVRNATNSYTINPTTGNVATFINPVNSTYNINGASLSTGSSLTFPDTTVQTTAFTTSLLSPYAHLAGGTSSNPQNFSQYVSFSNNVLGPSQVYPLTNSNNFASITYTNSGLATKADSSALLAYAPLASPVLTGNPQSVTPATTDNDTTIATTAYVKNNLTSYAPLASPLFTGNPQSVTPATTDNDISIATTAYVKNNLTSYAPLASPALTGIPTAPTYSSGSLQQIANVSYVQGYIQTSAPVVVNYNYSISLSTTLAAQAVGTQNSYTSSIGDTSQTVTFSIALSGFTLTFSQPIYLSPSTLITMTGTLTNTQTNQLSSLQYSSSTTNSLSFNISSGQTVVANVQYLLSFYVSFNKK